MIEVVNRQRLARIDAQRIARLGEAVLDTVGRSDATLTVAFVRDRVIRELNSKYRGNDRATDVLSFPSQDYPAPDVTAGADAGEVTQYIGDILVSTDTALSQAGDSGLSFDREVDELVIHGVLHLCGYDHETDRGQMNRLELKLRKKLLDPK